MASQSCMKVNIVSMHSFHQQLINSIEKKDSCVCVGLDSRYDLLPSFIKSSKSMSQSIFAFNKEIITVTHEHAAAYKSNVAFYAGFGAEGLEGLRLTNVFLQENYPDIPRLADCKRSEMGESVRMVKQEIFEWLGFNCVMVTPWFGQDTIRDYVSDKTFGVCVYAHDSNPTAPEIQAVRLENGQLLYEYLCERIVKHWNTNDNIFIEVGATYPEAFRNSRKVIGEDMIMLTAGVGKQGGAVADLQGSFGKHSRRILVNSSRGIIFAGTESDSPKQYFEKARKAAIQLQEEIQSFS